MTSIRQKNIDGLKKCIEGELWILQNISNGTPTIEQRYVIQETKASIKRLQEILKEYSMPLIRLHSIFTANGRYFKAHSITGINDIADGWYICEVLKREFDGNVFYEETGELILRGRKEMNNLLQQGKIQII